MLRYISKQYFSFPTQLLREMGVAQWASIACGAQALCRDG
jgi:hypothetical protein